VHKECGKEVKLALKIIFLKVFFNNSMPHVFFDLKAKKFIQNVVHSSSTPFRMG